MVDERTEGANEAALCESVTLTWLPSQSHEVTVTQVTSLDFDLALSDCSGIPYSIVISHDSHCEVNDNLLTSKGEVVEGQAASAWHLE